MAGDDCRRQARRARSRMRSATLRWVPAPQSDDPQVNGTVYGVYIEFNERIEWVYTITSDGNRFVIGYNILPLLPDSSEDAHF